jgi:hypothetical protein
MNLPHDPLEPLDEIIVPLDPEALAEYVAYLHLLIGARSVDDVARLFFQAVGRIEADHALFGCLAGRDPDMDTWAMQGRYGEPVPHGGHYLGGLFHPLLRLWDASPPQRLPPPGIPFALSDFQDLYPADMQDLLLGVTAVCCPVAPEDTGNPVLVFWFYRRAEQPFTANELSWMDLVAVATATALERALSTPLPTEGDER